ncbi:MAG: hypothetical protein IH895_10095 [Planctomycetes bacterium]|nr:hypothetical protein [Planctomycetota bacterium]
MSEIHAMLYEAIGDSSVLRRAIEELENALDLDSRRDPLEVRRFPAEKVAELQAKLVKLKSMWEDAEPRGLQPENP